MSLHPLDRLTTEETYRLSPEYRQRAAQRAREANLALRGAGTSAD